MQKAVSWLAHCVQKQLCNSHVWHGTLFFRVLTTVGSAMKSEFSTHLRNLDGIETWEIKVIISEAQMQLGAIVAVAAAMPTVVIHK